MRDDICLRCGNPDAATKRYAVKNRTNEPYCDDCARNIGEVHKITPAAPAAKAEVSDAPAAEETPAPRRSRTE